MFDIMDVFVKIGADTSGLEEGVDKSKGLIGGLSDKLGGIGSAVGSGLKMAGAAIGAATAAVGAFGGMAVKSYASYEQLVGGVETLYGNAYNSIEEYAEGTGQSLEAAAQTWEQYQGRQQQVLDNASKAYQTAGMDANTYMDTVNSFAASLNKSLGESAWQSANYADMAVQDMADNANKMGSDISSIQTAYQGFAKGNFTMLDNLKLGYGGTKTEMEKLLADAEQMEGLIEGSLSIDSFADIVDAIHIVQENMGITGTTSEEAMKTIEGSAAATKAAWENVITAVGRGEGLSEAFDSLSSAIFGENEGEGLLNQIIPRIQTTMEGIGEFIATAAPFISEKLPELIDAIVPSALEAAMQLLGAISDGIFQVLPTLMDTGKQLVEMLGQTLIENIPVMIPQIVELITQLAQMLADNADGIVAGVIQILTVLATSLLENAPTILNAVMQLAIAVAEAVLNNLPLLLESVIQVLGALLQAFITWIPQFMQSYGEFNVTVITTLLGYGAEILAKVGEFLGNLLTNIGEGLSNLLQSIGEWLSQLPSKMAYWAGYAIGSFIKFFMELPGKADEQFNNTMTNVTNFGKNLWDKAKEMAKNFFDSIVEGVKELPSNMAQLGEDLIDAVSHLPEKFMEIGSNIVDGIWNGISNGWNWLKEQVGNLAESLLQGVKDALGIHSPSKKFMYVGRMLDEGMIAGIESGMPSVQDAVDEMSNLVSVGNAGGFSNSSSVLAAMEKEQNPNRNLTVILELERTQLARAVYALNNEETQRVGLNLAGGYA